MKSKVCIVTLLLIMLLASVGLASPQTYNFNFVDEDVCVVLHTLARMGDVDIVIDDSVKGNITIKLNDVSFDTALDLITGAKGISYRKVGNSYIIENAEMGMTDVIKLKYTRAVDIKKTIEPITTSLKLKIEVDETSNSILVTGSPAGCARVKKMLKSLDVAEQQVEIEAKIVSINKTNTKDLGVDWTFAAGSPQYTPPNTTTNSTTGITTTTSNAVITPVNNGLIAQFGSNIVGIPYEIGFQPTINALVSKGDAKILASPKVTAINGKEARVFIGDHIPVLTESVANGVSVNTVTYVDSGIKLLYTPTITADGKITAKVRAEVSTPTLVSDIKNYRITTREAETTVCMKDGETVVIAGLLGSEVTKTHSQIPFLGDLPLVGSFFRSIHDSKTETEVVIFLTAKIVKA